MIDIFPVFRTGLAVIAAACALAPSAFAQTASYPSKTVTIVVPFQAGGGNDTFARHIAQVLSDAWKRQVVVDNRPGAGGNIGTAAVARSAPDGYTMLLSHTGTMSINPSLYAKVPYDAARDFVPLTLVASTPLLLVVHPSVKANSLSELIDLAKAKPRQLNYASSGSGTGAHLSAEMFKDMAKIDVVHIPYKGTGPATTDLLGGQVDMMFGVVPSTLPHVKSGKIKAIAVTGKTRLPSLPNVPTMEEAGLKGYESTLSYGLVAPRGTPDAVVKEIHAQVSKALVTPKLRDLLATEGAVPVVGDSGEYSALIKAETLKWAKIIKDAGIQVD